MTIDELTRALGAEIQKHPAYVRLGIAKQNNDEDQELQDDIGKLNLIRIQFNTEQSKESDIDNQKLEQLNNEFKALYGKIMRNENMTEYNAAKEAMDAVMNDITAILAMCVNGEDPQTCQPPQKGCSGSCSSCSGCH